METIDFNEVIRDNIEVVEELIGIADENKDGLMPKSLYPYRLSDTNGLKEISGDGDFLLILRHPYGFAHLIASVNTAYGNPLCSITKIGAKTAEIYISVYTDNKKIYVDNKQRNYTWIIPLNGRITINNSSAEVSTMTKIL